MSLRAHIIAISTGCLEKSRHLSTPQRRSNWALTRHSLQKARTSAPSKNRPGSCFFDRAGAPLRRGALHVPRHGGARGSDGCHQTCRCRGGGRGTSRSGTAAELRGTRRYRHLISRHAVESFVPQSRAGIRSDPARWISARERVGRWSHFLRHHFTPGQSLRDVLRGAT